MQRDFAYCLWQVIDSGLTITAHYALLVNWFAIEPRRLPRRTAAAAVADRPFGFSVGARADRGARAGARGKLGWPKFGPGLFRRCYRHLVIAYDPREWWQHDAWSPKFDARIPLRVHEPSRGTAGYDFLVIEQPWLREALKWQLKIALETGLLRWTTVSPAARLADALQPVHRRARDRRAGACAPIRAELRLLALDFLATSSSAARRCGREPRPALTSGRDRHDDDSPTRAVLRVHGRPQARGRTRARPTALGGARRPTRPPLARG